MREENKKIFSSLLSFLTRMFTRISQWSTPFWKPIHILTSFLSKNHLSPLFAPY